VVTLAHLVSRELLRRCSVVVRYDADANDDDDDDYDDDGINNGRSLHRIALRSRVASSALQSPRHIGLSICICEWRMQKL